MWTVPVCFSFALLLFLPLPLSPSASVPSARLPLAFVSLFLIFANCRNLNRNALATSSGPVMSRARRSKCVFAPKNYCSVALSYVKLKTFAWFRRRICRDAIWTRSLCMPSRPCLSKCKMMVEDQRFPFKMSSMDAHCCLECCLESMSLYAGTQQIRNWIRYWVRCCAIGFAIRFTARFTTSFPTRFATMNSPPNS